MNKSEFASSTPAEDQEQQQFANSRPLNTEADLALADQMRLWEDLAVRFCFVTTAGRGRRLQAHLASPDAAHPFDQPAPAVRLQFGAHLLEVPGLVREAAAEVLFTHSDEPDSRSVAQLLLDAVAEAHVDLRRELLRNVLIVGGISRLPGFLARLKTELLNLIADGYRPQLARTLVDIQFYQFPREVAGQLFCAWLGGSIFGSVDDNLDQRSLTKKQWQAKRWVPDWTNPIDAYLAELPDPPIGTKSADANATKLSTAEDCDGGPGKRIERAI